MSGDPTRAWHERGRVGRLQRWLSEDVWQLELTSCSPPRAFLLRCLRLCLIARRAFFAKDCLREAAALTYVTVFSLPPLLAFAFSAAKGFGLYELLKGQTIDPFLDRTFGTAAGGADAGVSQIRSAIDQIFAFVEGTDLRTLAGFSLALALYSAIKMLSAVERTFNNIWGVRRPRTLVRRVTDYISILIVTPLFLASATGVTLALSSERVRGLLGGWSTTFAPVLALLPILALWLGLTFMYLTLPNTRVRIASALVGGAVAGLLWQVSQVMYIEFQVGLARLNAIYAGFAAVPMLLGWFYLTWVIVLIGAELAFAHQDEHRQTALVRTGPVDQASRAALAPRLAGRIARAFLGGARPPAAQELAAELGVAAHVVDEILERLAEHRLLARTPRDGVEGWLPARDPQTIAVLDLLLALRRGPASKVPPVRSRLDERTDRVLAALEAEAARSLHNHTLSELAAALDDAGSAGEEARGSEGATRPAPLSP
jgi:membrane protein